MNIMHAIKININDSSADIISDLDKTFKNKSSDDFVWVDLLSGDKQRDREVLEQFFNISPLSVDDAQRDRHPPKIERFKNYNFLLIKAFDAETKDIDFNILHISFFIGKDFILTVHDGESPSINAIWEDYVDGSQDNIPSPYVLLSLILKRIIARYTSVILGLENRLDEIEKIMSEKPSDSILTELIRYSTKTQYLYRIFKNQDIVFKEMLVSDENIQTDELKHKFQDVQENMQRLSGLTGLLNEVTKNLVDGYISVSGHRLNNIMKILTIVALVFMPITFLAGIYGMNFEHMPELAYENAYFIVLGVMAVMVVGLLFLFKKLKWL